MIPIILTLLVPGLGQLYYGKNIRGIVMIILGITPLYLLVLTWSLIDVVMLNHAGAVPVYKPKDAWWTIAILVVIVPAFLFIVILSAITAGQWYSNHYTFPEQTRHEIRQISKSLSDYHAEFGMYPASLNDIAKESPIRAEWHNDSWGQPYHYDVSEDGNSFNLISGGPDMTLNTRDDIMASDH